MSELTISNHETRTELARGADEEILGEIREMESAGWSVRLMVPASSEAWTPDPEFNGPVLRYNTGYFITYERSP